MALPELFMPASLPYFKAADHVRTPDSVYAGIERQGGFDRRRRVFTSAPQMLETMLEVTQAQLEEFYAWHEGPLKAGAEPFTAYVSAGALAIQYWEAYILEFKVEHKEGNLHDISLKIRLKGSPSAASPVASSLTAEVAVPMLWTFDFVIGTGLSAEVLIALAFSGETGASFSAEVLLDLQTEFVGTLLYAALSAEVLANLEFYGIALPSDALAAEATCALDFAEQLGVALSAEVTVALDFGITSNVGYRSPANFSVASQGSPFRGYVYSWLMVDASGRIYTQQDRSGFVLQGVYYAPPTADVAVGKWLRVDVLSTDGGNTEGPLGTNIQMTSGSTYQFSASRYYDSPAPNPVTTVLRVKIASDPDIYNILSTFDVTLSAEVV
jgi:hypothetical protein